VKVISDARTYRRLVVATLAIGFVLVLVGGIVRVEGAGMGCGDDWPVCNGEVIPTMSYLTAIEFTHRVIAGIVLVLSIALVVLGRRALAGVGRLALLPAVALALVVAQALLGAVTVFVELDAWAVTAHLGMAQAFLAALVVLALLLTVRDLGIAGRGAPTSLSPIAVTAAGAIYLLMLSGAYTATTAAAWACPEWPACHGNYLPTGASPVDIHLLHRWLAVIAIIAVGAVVVSAWRARRGTPVLLGLAGAAAALMFAQVFVGAANIWFELNSWVRVAHLGVATLIWAALIGVVVLDRALPAEAIDASSSSPARRPARAIVADYVEATKPGVMILLLLTTLAAMIAGAVGLPPLRILVWTLVGGALSAGGAAAINQYIDRDIDAIMTRTRTRPIPAGRVAPVQFAIYGVVLTVLSVLVLTAFVSPLVALITLSGNVFYVFVYTLWLKRSTPQNIVIGGAAGSVPPVAGWAAVTGGIAAPAILMFWLIFLWTPPHFWALALFKRGDYAAAGVPMLPAVRGDAETRKQILLYSLLMVGASLLFVPFGGAGALYAVAATAFGGWFIYRAALLYRSHADRDARRLFFYSIQYLGLIFLALVVDRLVGR
jgi:protoheme IX farnesyltransferase